MAAEALSAVGRLTRWARGRWRVLLLALLVLVVALDLTKSLVRAGRDLVQLPVHGQYQAPTEGFLRGVIGPMSEVRASLLDPQGVLLFDYGGDLGRQYNPLFIADFAMSMVHLWGEAEARDILLANLEHLIATAVKTPGGNLRFPFGFDFPAAGERAPWYSAMAQARVGQALMWGWRLSGDPRYLGAAKAAILAMTEVDQNPPIAKPLARGVWLNEFPGNRFYVLDGSLVALVGVQEVYRGLPADDDDRERIGTLFGEALAGFKANQGCFTTPFGGVFFTDAGQITESVLLRHHPHPTCVPRGRRPRGGRHRPALFGGGMVRRPPPGSDLVAAGQSLARQTRAVGALRPVTAAQTAATDLAPGF